MAQFREENRLISLIEKAKTACQSIAQAVRNDMKTIGEARAVGMKWAEIADGLGFPGKDFEVRRAYSREKARQEKKGVMKLSVSQPQKTENEKQKKDRPPMSKLGTKKEQGGSDFFDSLPKI